MVEQHSDYNFIMMVLMLITLTGLSDDGGDGEPAVQLSAPFVERHDVSTPLMTPPKSMTPTLRTLSRSSSDEPTAAEPPPVLSARQLPPASKEPAIEMVDAATECAL